MERSEREEKEVLLSLYGLWRSGSRFLANQELMSEYSARATHGHRKFQVLPMFRTGG